MAKRVFILLLVLLSLFALACAEVPTVDRAGNVIALPQKIERIVSLAPATTQILESLGILDLVVGVDTQTPQYVAGAQALPQFDMMAPDAEQIALLQPDVVFTSGMSYLDGNPYAKLTELGICVVQVPTAESLQGIQDDILFYGAVLGKEEDAKAIVLEMQAQMEAVAKIGHTISEKKDVLFEISALPYLYSFGQGTFLDEMIRLIGANNVFGDQTSWISVTEESAILSNPDVILTSVNYLDDPVGEILSRQGWDEVKAIQNQQVFAVDNAKSSLPNQYVVDALLQMAVAVYPEAFAAYAEAPLHAD